MSMGEIAVHLVDVYGTEVSRETICKIDVSRGVSVCPSSGGEGAPPRGLRRCTSPPRLDAFELLPRPRFFCRCCAPLVGAARSPLLGPPHPPTSGELALAQGRLKFSLFSHFSRSAVAG